MIAPMSRRELAATILRQLDAGELDAEQALSRLVALGGDPDQAAEMVQVTLTGQGDVVELPAEPKSSLEDAEE